MPHRSTYQGLEELFQPWRPEYIDSIASLKALGGFENIKNRYQEMEKIYGYAMDIPVGLIRRITYVYYQEKMHAALERLVKDHADIDRSVTNTLGYWYLQDKQLKLAIKYFTLNTKRHPEDANLWDSLGDGYKAQEQYKLAAKYYRKAIEVGTQNNDPQITMYNNNLESVEQLTNK